MVLLPWFQEDRRRRPAQLKTISDCGTCMETTTRINRQGRGCGFEPPAPPFVQVMPWLPPSSTIGYQYPRPKICAGYLTRLPEVVEVARAHAHWSKGSIAAFCDGEQPTEHLIRLVEILDAEAQQLQIWALTPKDKGGGRE